MKSKSSRLFVGAWAFVPRGGVVGLFLLSYGLGPLWAGEESILPAGEYAAVAERAIEGARSSVHLFLYLFNVQASRPGEGPSRLLRALGRAHRRGVSVDVVLDPGDSPFGPMDRNRLAAEALGQMGIPVSYVEGPLLHAKVLIVDRRTIFLGSSNWTTAAFGENVEADAVIRSTAAAESLLTRLGALPRRKSSVPAPRGDVLVPTGLLFPPGKLGEMVRRKDDAALDLYLHFLREGYSAGKFTPLDNAVAMEALGRLDRGPVANRRQLHKIFRRLNEVYGLAEARETYGKDPEVRLLPLSSTDTVALPGLYFSAGWARRLSLAAKMFLLLNLYYSPRSSAAPQWSWSRAALAETHGLKKETISVGSVELRRFNLLEVDYDDAPTPEDPHRRPNIYWPEPFYDPADVEGRWRALEKAHGAEALARGRRVARLVYQDNDPLLVEKAMELEKTYGRAVMEEALHLLGKKHPDNPKRNFRYLVGLVRGLAGKEQGGSAL